MKKDVKTEAKQELDEIMSDEHDLSWKGVAILAVGIVIMAATVVYLAIAS